MCRRPRYYGCMFSADQYRLLDFGDGRKLEQFGRYVLDRPSPAAAGIAKADPPQWELAQCGLLPIAASPPAAELEVTGAGPDRV